VELYWSLCLHMTVIAGNWCGKCPTQTSIQLCRDNTRLEWKLKTGFIATHLTIVTPSTWLTEQAKQSMLSACPFIIFPMALTQKPSAPWSWTGSFPARHTHFTKVLMFAVQVQQIPVRVAICLKALSSLPASLKPATDSVMAESHTEAAGIASWILATSAAIALNQSPIVLLTCLFSPRVPIICHWCCKRVWPVVRRWSLFKVGGVPDLVRPGITGYLATPEDVKDL